MDKMGYVHRQYLYGLLVNKCGRGMELHLGLMVNCTDFGNNASIAKLDKSVRELARRNGIPITLSHYAAKDPNFCRPKEFRYSDRTWVYSDTQEPVKSFIP